jgi:hypothetical protein
VEHSLATCDGVGSQMGEQHVQERQGGAAWPAVKQREELLTLLHLLWARYDYDRCCYTVTQQLMWYNNYNNKCVCISVC